MLISADQSCLFIVDMQSRLLPAVYDPKTVVRNCRILLEAAARLGAPILAVELNPAGIGPTVDPIAGMVPDGAVMEKIHFSSYAEAPVRARAAATGRRQMVVAGMEAHVCVLQTAIDFAGAGYETFVVSDATASRTPENHQAALARLAANGIEIVTTEMVVFEWLHSADVPEFRDLLRLIK
jgi:nicotinamidase-related amidase